VNPSLLSVSYARETQRRDELEAAIADWRRSHGEEHVRDRRYALALIAADRARSALRRAEVAAAIRRNALRRAA
jgi:hypothetical protein